MGSSSSPSPPRTTSSSPSRCAQWRPLLPTRGGATTAAHHGPETTTPRDRQTQHTRGVCDHHIIRGLGPPSWLLAPCPTPQQASTTWWWHTRQWWGRGAGAQCTGPGGGTTQEDVWLWAVPSSSSSILWCHHGPFWVGQFALGASRIRHTDDAEAQAAPRGPGAPLRRPDAFKAVPLCGSQDSAYHRTYRRQLRPSSQQGPRRPPRREWGRAGWGLGHHHHQPRQQHIGAALPLGDFLSLSVCVAVLALCWRIIIINHRGHTTTGGSSGVGPFFLGLPPASCGPCSRTGGGGVAHTDRHSRPPPRRRSDSTPPWAPRARGRPPVSAQILRWCGKRLLRRDHCLGGVPAACGGRMGEGTDLAAGFPSNRPHRRFHCPHTPVSGSMALTPGGPGLRPRANEGTHV